MSKFFHHLDLPLLDDFFVREAIVAEFETVSIPSSLNRARSSFGFNNFSRLINSSLGEVGSSYHKHPANTLYDWHIDNKRSCAIVWVIRAGTEAKTLYREPVPDARLFYNLTEVDYTMYKPTLLNTTYEHCVVNSCNEDRITLNMSIFNTTYEQALEFFQNLKINSYSNP